MKSPLKPPATIGERLRRLRQATGMTQRQVEAVSEISNAYLSQLETGKISNPSIKFLSALASTYGVTVEELADPVSPLLRRMPASIPTSAIDGLSEAELAEVLGFIEFVRFKRRAT